MIKVGLTGGIGTGKSFVANYFKKRGIAIFDADIEAKKLYNLPEVIHEISTTFGNYIVKDEKIDFSIITPLIFSDDNFRKQLEQILHPRVKKKFIDWCDSQSSPMVIMEAAIIYEAGFQSLFDYIIVVDAPDELRMNRLLLRNPQFTKEIIQQRINIQLPQSEKRKLADFVIKNDNSTPLFIQIDNIMSEILTKEQFQNDTI